MSLAASTRLTAHLNSVLGGAETATAAVSAVVADDVAHHVVDASALLNLDPERATALDEAWPALLAAESRQWLLALPRPGRLSVLRGPAQLNVAALAAGSAVVASGGGVALVPHQVGRAVQWQVLSAERPFSAPAPAEAERSLGETVLTAATTLSRLEVAAGRRPGLRPDVVLAPGYDARQQAGAERAARLLLATTQALENDGGSLSSFEVTARAAELRAVRDAATEALSAAASWLRR